MINQLVRVCAIEDEFTSFYKTVPLVDESFVFVQLEKLEAEQKAIEAEEARTLATRKGKDKAKRAAR